MVDPGNKDWENLLKDGAGTVSGCFDIKDTVLGGKKATK